jgi:SUR7/PalI family
VIDVPTNFLKGLESDAQHDLGIYDFYRYGLWGFCEGYNTTVIHCTDPKPGNATNPIAAINDEITKKDHLPLPQAVEKDVNRLTSASLFIFSCWIIGPAFALLAIVQGLFHLWHSRLLNIVFGITITVRGPNALTDTARFRSCLL